MNTTLNFLFKFYHKALTTLPPLQSVAALGARLYVASVFWQAGMVKINNWDTTLFLFEEEYEVPVLTPVVAAYLGTFGELFFPVLLALGLTTRAAAVSLSIVNVVAVISLTEIAPAAFYLHVIWGVLLAQLALFGGGFLSADRLFAARSKDFKHFHSLLNYSWK